MSVPLPRSRALSFVLAFAAAVLGAWPERDGDPAARCTRRPTTPPATPCSDLTAPPTARCRPPERSRPAASGSPTRRAPGRCRAQRRRPQPVRGQRRLRQRLRLPPGRRGGPVDAVGSRGLAPVSIDEHRGRVYVLNSGGTASVSASSRRSTARWAIPGGTRGARAGRQRRRAGLRHPDGRSLVVSERVANRLETLPLDRFGRPGAPVVTASSGAVPFGFGITQRGTIVVSEAGASTVSSYRLGRRRAPHASPPRWRSARARPAGSPCRRTGASPTRATQRQHQRLRDRP